MAVLPTKNKFYINLDLIRSQYEYQTSTNKLTTVRKLER